jgi:3-hydroxybutyryl-CoA dehydrogenase
MNKSAGKTDGKKKAKAKAAEHVVIVGAGRMGADIAMAFALNGWQCDVVETNARVRARVIKYWDTELRRMRSKAKMRNLNLWAAMQGPGWLKADLVVEVVPEDLELKHKLLKKIEPLVRKKTIIATNTSSLRISDITGVLKHPERGAGFHLGVPAHILLAVEITKGEKTSSKTIEKLTAWTRAMGKVPIVLNRDIPGMLINRLQHAMYREIYHLIDSGVATPHDIDCAVRFGFGFKYSIVGPVFSRDIHGVPVHLATATQIYPTLYNGVEPSATLTRMVKDGHHGVTTGRGFYKWPKATTEKRLEAFATQLGDAFKRIKRVGEPADF